MLLTCQARGVYAIAPTPFLPDGVIDEVSISRMAEFYAATGVDGLTVLGIMGEANKLLPEEAVTVVKATIAGFSGRPVIVGVSSPGLQSMRELAREAMDGGAAGVMFTPPSAMRTDEQISTYVRQAVEAIGSDVPFVLQDHPTVTGVVMSSQLIRRIVQETPSCVMLKHEDWPGLEKISLLRHWQNIGEMRELAILCGNGGLFLDCEMARGADGAMTGYAFPEMLIDVVAYHTVGNRVAAQDIYDAHLPLLRYEQQPGVGLAVRKHVLSRRGAIAHSALRSPGPSLSSKAVAEIDFLLERLSVHDRRAAL
ncbi:MAG: dihydrodipicolinate synthase family protein [Mesorhizobium sp.]|uniref:dihydrodipicolinate synthase family protein n=1 Tax=Mesorhizobium sp. M1D.F.Ca.ET.043.01.1.1 TaxID=2493669 RepID=UPI000F756EE8|nr:dihydrodipicolinate synthase family protein [Mesorhizobium sp. M1D.F.Ca.ET.043.01.1.1]AZO71320.1 dihydrodipicolinate synthase family protein [Mesorhizobium sp. M1D.F.Ca.ET.043.01.1.1]TIV70171.1 MAG: dihydrodipicolinate synthase family protein [Mesorhizobium sp.]